MSADFIFTNGRVHTIDAGNHIAEALAVEGDTIAAVGSTADVTALAGPNTRRIDLAGRSLLPGFIDAHAHFPWLGTWMGGIDCKAPGMQSIRALQEEVRKKAATLPPGTWIRGAGYDQSRLAEQRHPNRWDWDAVAPDHPVVFTRTCGHIMSVNSRALALAGITDETPDPEGGRFDRENGRNLGVCYETAQNPIAAVSVLSRQEFRDGLARANRAYLAAGATSVHDAGGLVGPAFAPAQDMVAAGEIQVRLYAFTTVSGRDAPIIGILNTGLHTGFGNEQLRLGAFKVITDGSSSGPTAATRDPYTSNSDDSGILYHSQEALDGLIGEAHRRGFQCTVHAVGDRAIEQTLNAMARAMVEHPRENLRHRIEHCGITPPDLRTRIRAMGIVPAMQPAFFWEFGDGYIRNYGRERADMMFPVKSMLDLGVIVAGSSDAPVTDYRPLFGIEQAMTRATNGGDVCGPHEAVDIATALRLYTWNAAYASFEEHRKGSLEVGKLADLTLLGSDITRVPAKEVRHIPVAMTLVGGRVVHEAS